MDQFESFTDLHQAVVDYLDRTDITSAQIDLFISMGVTKIMRRLRTVHNEGFEAYPLVPDTPYTTLTVPSDYLEAKSFTADGEPMRRVGHRVIQGMLARQRRTGPPRLFGRKRNQFLIYPLPDSDEIEFELLYWADLRPTINDAGSDAEDVLAVMPDLFLYGALVESRPFLKSEEESARLQQWKMLFEESLETINAQDDNESVSGSAVVMNSAYGDTRATRRGR